MMAANADHFPPPGSVEVSPKFTTLLLLKLLTIVAQKCTSTWKQDEPAAKVIDGNWEAITQPYHHNFIIYPIFFWTLYNVTLLRDIV